MTTISKNIDTTCIHHTAVSYDKNPDQFMANNRYHQNKWGVESSLGYYLGYTYEIAKDGTTRQARQEGERTVAAYQQDMNSGRCVHIALDGNFDQQMPTKEQEEALRNLLLGVMERHKIKKERVIFHRDLAPKTCPGNNITKDYIYKLIETNMILKRIMDQTKEKHGDAQVAIVMTPDDEGKSYLIKGGKRYYLKDKEKLTEALIALHSIGITKEDLTKIDDGGDL